MWTFRNREIISAWTFWNGRLVFWFLLLAGEYKQEEVDSILEEGLKLKHFQHQNVLSLIGVCVEASSAPYIITPFMSNGSLLHYLRRRRGTLVLSKQEDEDTVSIINGPETREAMASSATPSGSPSKLLYTAFVVSPPPIPFKALL